MRSLLSVKEVARLLNCKPSTIYAWAKAGIIPHYKIGQLVRFNQEEIGEWLKKFKKEANSTKKTLTKYPGNSNSYDIDNLVRKAIDEAKVIKV